MAEMCQRCGDMVNEPCEFGGDWTVYDRVVVCGSCFFEKIMGDLEEMPGFDLSEFKE